MPRLISRSPSESSRMILLSGCARARPKAKPAWPPIAGSPNAASYVSISLIFAQCGEPRPEMTIASFRWAAMAFSASAVCIMAGSPSAVETVEFVADQDHHRPLRLLRLGEGDADPVGVGVALDQIAVEAQGVAERLGEIGRATCRE